MYMTCTAIPYGSNVFTASPVSKFDVTPGLENNLATRCTAASIKEVSMTDKYFDNSSISLTSNNLWLRLRNSSFELKWPRDLSSHNQESSFIDVYNESNNWDVICETIKQVTGIDCGTPPCSQSSNELEPVHYENWLHEQGIVPFAVIVTNRRSYPLTLCLSQWDDLSVKVKVDIDNVTYVVDSGDDQSIQPSREYNLGEVELQSRLPEKCDPSALMTAVCQELAIGPLQSESHVGTSTGRARRGKVEEFLARFRPEHYTKIFLHSAQAMTS
jgi:hypothetical protein